MPHEEELQQTEPVQQRTVEQVVDAPNVDQAPLNVTHRVPANAARKGASHEPCDLSWSESSSTRRLDAGTQESALYLFTANVIDARVNRASELLMQIPANLENETVLKTVGVDDALCPPYFSGVAPVNACDGGTSSAHECLHVKRLSVTCVSKLSFAAWACPQRTMASLPESSS